MRKMIIGLLLLCLLLGFQTVFADGTCGTNVKYTISGSTITFSKEDPDADAEWFRCDEVYKNDPSVTVVKVSDVIRVRDRTHAFANAAYVKKMYLSKLDVSGVTDMSWWFSNCSALTYLDVSGWNTSKVTMMRSTFSDCSLLTTLKMSGWKTGRVTDMNSMFYYCSSLKSLDLNSWNVSRVTNMENMFHDCSSLTSLKVGRWNTSRVTNMIGTFFGCSGLTALDVSGWNTSAVTEMGTLFENCSGLTSLDVSRWNTSSVTKMDWVFANCTSLTSLDLGVWDTSNVTTMYGLFTFCSALRSVEVSNWNTSKVTNMEQLFTGCSQLGDLDLSGWNTSNVTNRKTAFSGCSSLKTLKFGKNSLKTDIFENLPAHGGTTWYYIKPGPEAGSPLPALTAKSNSALFTAYKYNTMAGIWSTNKNPAISAAVTIKNSGGTNITGKTITSKTVNYQLKASASPTGSVQNFTWRSSNNAVATVGVKGKVTFKKAGTVTITVTSMDVGKASASVKLKLLPAATAITIMNSKGTDITGKTLTMDTAGYQLKASAAPANAEQTVKWTSSDSTIATVTSAGKVTFKKTGTVTITAVSTDRGKASAKVVLKRLPAATAITIRNSKGTDITGTLRKVGSLSYQLTASAKPAKAEQTVTWTSSNPVKARVDKTGKVKFLAPCTVTITATSTDRGKVSATVRLKYLPLAGDSTAEQKLPASSENR